MPKKILGNKTDYKFKEPKNTACFVCNHVLEKNRPILFVSHESNDGSWQFLCGENDHSEENIRIISIEEAIKLDSTLNELYEMPEGFGAERKEVGKKWKPFKNVE